MKQTKNFLIACSIEYDDESEFFEEGEDKHEIPDEINIELKECIIENLNISDEVNDMFMDSICENTIPYCPIRKVKFSIKE